MDAPATDEPVPEQRRALGRLLDEVVKAMGARRGAVFLLRNGELGIAESRDDSGRDLSRATRWAWRLVRKVVAEGHPCSGLDDGSPDGPKASPGTGIQLIPILFVMCVPLARGGGVRGVLLVDAPVGSAAFLERPLSDLASFADRILEALGNEMGPE